MGVQVELGEKGGKVNRITRRIVGLITLSLQDTDRDVSNVKYQHIAALILFRMSS